MTTLPPPLDALPELYLRLVRRVEKLEGQVKQLLAEGTRDTLPTLTWKDLDALKKDLAEMQRQLSDKQRR
jgi:N-acetylglucosamine-6-phosphate deacetylase